jgi:hypothetical protein
LSGILLFNDTILSVRHHFILNGKGGEESKIAERQRECVCVCDRACKKEEVAFVVKRTVEKA